MWKLLLTLLLTMAGFATVRAQLRDFPIAWNGWELKSDAKLSGAVHTILTIEQRDERTFGTWTDVYDRSGNRISNLYQSAAIAPHSNSMVRLGNKTTYQDSSTGRLENATDFSLEGNADRRYTLTYDSEGRLTESAAYDGGKISRRTLYIHSPERREIEIKNIFYHDGREVPSEKTVLAYNANNQWVRRTTYKTDGSVNATIDYEYNSKGNLIKEVHCCEYGYTHRYEYKYDRYGNWIERQDIYSQKHAGGETEVNPNWMYTYRVITYFDEQSGAHGRN
jgi:YD repeat-containing protein